MQGCCRVLSPLSQVRVHAYAGMQGCAGHRPYFLNSAAYTGLCTSYPAQPCIPALDVDLFRVLPGKMISRVGARWISTLHVKVFRLITLGEIETCRFHDYVSH